MTRMGVREIGRRTGYSPATVSNALNRKPGVSEKAVAAILACAEEIGYQHPGRIEGLRFLIARKSGRILDEGTFHPGVIDGAERQAKQMGFPLSFSTLELSDKEGARSQTEAMCRDAATGIILLGTEMDEDDYDLFAESDAPIVVCDGWSDRYFFESVVTSNENSAYRAVTYLLEHGHRKIGYICGETVIRNFPLRERGYVRALREYGLIASPAFRVTVGTTVSSSYASMRAWLEHHPQLPTAFFAENDIMALGCMRALSEYGVEIPNEVSMFGFDDLNFASIANPPLTTMRVPNRAMGELAVKALIESVRQPTDYSRVTHLSTTLVERQSVRTIET